MKELIFNKRIIFLTLNLILNILFGIGYSNLLISPTLSNFEINNIVNITAVFLVFYNTGKFVAGLMDQKFNRLFMGYSLIVAIILNSIGFLIRFQFSFFSSFLLGYSMVLGSISLREILTKYESISLKKLFNSVSIVGWSSGVAISSYINKYSNIFYFVLVFLVVIGLYLSFKIYISDKIEFNSNNKINTESGFSHILMSKNLYIIFFGVLIYNLTISIVNINISSYLKSYYEIPVQNLSPFLALPIIGAVLSGIIPGIELIKIKPEYKYIFLKTLTIILAIILFSRFNLYFSIVSLILLGYSTNEETAYSYQLIYENSQNVDKRTIHALIDIISVIGSLFAWILIRTSISMIYNLFYIFILFIVASFFFAKSNYFKTKKDL